MQRWQCLKEITRRDSTERLIDNGGLFVVDSFIEYSLDSYDVFESSSGSSISMVIPQAQHHNNKSSTPP